MVDKLAREGMTLLLVTHEMYLARKICNRVVFRHQGRVHKICAPDGVLSNPKTVGLKKHPGMIQ